MKCTALKIKNASVPPHRIHRINLNPPSSTSGFHFCSALLLTILMLLAGSPYMICADIMIFEPNGPDKPTSDFSDPHYWSHDTGGADADSGCNRITGFVGAYANAWLGSGTAEAQQKIIVPVPYSTESQRISIDVEIVRSGGAYTFGYGGFAGTEKTWAIGDDYEYHRSSVDDWLNYEIAVSKIIDIIALYGGQAGTVGQVLGYLGNLKTGYDLGLILADLLDDGDAEILHIKFDYDVPPETTQVPIWAGLRATASGCLTGWGNAVSVGKVKRFTVYGLDRPEPPLIEGTDNSIQDAPLTFRFTNTSSMLVKFEISWNDPYSPEPNVLTNWVDPNEPGNENWIELVHTYSEAGQYKISVNAIATNQATSHTTTHDIIIVPHPPTGVSASDGIFTDRVRITWNTDVNDPNEYRVCRASSPDGPKRIMHSFKKGISYQDEHYSPPDSNHYYWVEARRGRSVISDYSQTYDLGWRKELLDFDFNNDYSVDIYDLWTLVDYWLQSGVDMSESITEPNEHVNFIHYAAITANIEGHIPDENDTEPPSVPQCLRIRRLTDTTVSLSWNPSTDNVDVAGYNIYCNNYLLDSIGGTSYTDYGLNPSTVYSYTVSAYDRADNHSAQTKTVSARTDDGPNLLFNSSFESGTVNWTYYWSADIDNTTAHHGQASLHIIPDNYIFIATQQLSFMGGTTYTLSGWMKANGINDKEPIFGLSIGYERWDGLDWVTIESTVLDPVSGTTDWQPRSVTFDVHKLDETARVVCYWLIMDGEGWFDDIKLTASPQCNCTDNDGDGYGDPASSYCPYPGLLDCNDNNPNINPQAQEICDDEIDNDCDGLIDCNDPDCQDDPYCL